MYTTKITSGSKEFIASGSLNTFDQTPILLEISDNNKKFLKIQFEFKTDKDISETRTEVAINEDTMVFSLTNYDNPLGTGLVEPLQFAKYNSKLLYILFYVYSHSTNIKTIIYSIYSCNESENGENNV